ncbi:hypothetical protein B566_EDAN010122 [Ephemera danica]|nr:hypothetical protein B566_EDAN010122 [Ephemera danica]
MIGRSRFAFQCKRQLMMVAHASSVAAPMQQTTPRPYTDIPGPKPLPLIGNAWRFLPFIGTFNTSDMMAWCTDLRTMYGDIVRLSGLPGRKDMVFVYNPDDIENVLRNEGPWPERIVLDSMQYYRSHVRADFFKGNQGLANENGEKWHQARTIVNQPMMQPRVAKQYVPKIDQVAIDFVQRMKELRNEQNELPADFKNELHKWALESIALVALDTRLGCLEPNLAPDSDPQRMIHAAIAIFQCAFDLDMKIPIWKLLSTPTWRNFVKQCDAFVEIALKYVEHAQQSMQSEASTEDMSVLQNILQRDPDPKRAVVMAIDIMVAGIDTTSNTAAFLMYHLAKNPEKQERLFEELCKIMPDTEQPITPQMLDEMKYLKACQKEAMRLSPIGGGTERTSVREMVLSNYVVPKGVEVMLLSGVIGRLDQYFPDADKFIPERWLRGPSQHKNHPFVYLPFGFGPRQCVGMRFANLELETLVARVFRDYRLEWHHDDMKYASQLLNMAASPLQYTMINRV